MISKWFGGYQDRWMHLSLWDRLTIRFWLWRQAKRERYSAMDLWDR